MKRYVIYGKVDNRVIAYPLIRAMSIGKKVAVITDDRSFRRLYHGTENVGEVSGIDIFISDPNRDGACEDLMANTGIKYDVVVYVAEDFIPNKVDGVVSCIGVDYSLQGDEYTEKVSGDTGNGTGYSADIVVDKEPDFSEGVSVVKVIISFDAPKKSTEREPIILKDSNLRYVYECEEKKRLRVCPDKAFNTKLSGMLSKLTGIDKKEAMTLLVKKEHNTDK